MKRRLFIIIALFFVLGISKAQNTNNTGKPKAYMVADAHLDTQWNWDIQTTISDYVWRTINQNLFLMKHYPDYVFNFEGGIKYAWMKEYYPDQYQELKKYIKMGRWHIAGSSMEASDVLVASPESSIRSIMLGQSFYRHEFGAEGMDIFLPDCFGFGWTLPTIATHCGLIGFSSQKLNWRYLPFYGKDKYPFTIGLWKGIDGSSVMMAHSYDYTHHFKGEDLSQSKELIDLASKSPTNITYRYYGTGDRGGSPDMKSVISVEKGLHNTNPLITIINATSDQLYKDFLPYSKHPELPVFDGELLMDVHGTGCYTSQAALKLYNRENEQLGDAAERTALAADWLGGYCYPEKTLSDAWTRVILHQFHDDLTGTSIPRAYEFSWNDELISLKQYSDIITSSVNSVAAQMDTRVKGIPIIVYNPHAYPISDKVEIEIPCKAEKFSVYNVKGEKVNSQFVGYKENSSLVLIDVNVPAVGYAVYDINPIKNKHLETLISQGNSIENSIYKIVVDEKGDISSLYDKINHKELVEEGKVIRLAVFPKNDSYAWPAWEVLKSTIDQSPVSITDSIKIKVVENGLLRKTICIEKKYGESRFKQYIHLYTGALSNRIDFYNEVDWRSSHALLKAEFPLNLSNQKATYDLGIGSIERGNNTPTAYEVYAQQWADLTDSDNSYGVSILNDCKYGWDKPDNHTLRLSLIHTPGTSDRYVYQNRQDFGYHTFTYSIIGHVGSLDKSAISIEADKLNQALKAFVATKHKGKLGKEFSFASSNNQNIAVKAFKKAHDSDECVIRLYELGGKSTQKAVITFAGDIENACEADGTEKEIGKAVFDKNELQVEIEPFHVKTFKVKLRKNEINGNDYMYMPLIYDRRCTSWNGFRDEADFESENSYAAELLPDSIMTVNNVSFRLGNKDLENGVTCNGNVIQLPERHKYNKLYFLAASTLGDNRAVFQVGSNKQSFTVPYYSGFIGQWGHVGHTKGFLKGSEIAFVGTHRHTPEKDEPYEYTYMFKYGMDIPKDAKQIILPKDNHIVIFAITLNKEDSPAIKNASKMFSASLNKNNVETSAMKNNLLSEAKIIACSGYRSESEKPDCAIDGNQKTLWCDMSIAPNYIDFDLGKPYAVSTWKLINDGNERSSYITQSCFLQGKNNLNEEWKTLDKFDDNSSNIVERLFGKKSVRYVRLLVTKGVQLESGSAARICEFGLYE